MWWWIRARLLEKYPLLLIIIVSLILRTTIFIIDDGLTWDAPSYLGQAASLVAGELGETRSEFGFAGRMVLVQALPMLIGLFSQLFGSVLLTAKVISFTTSLLVVGLTYLLGKSLFGRKVGLAASLISATYPPFVIQAGEVVIESIASFFILLSLLLFTKVSQRRYTSLLMLTTAGVLAAAVLVRPVSILILILLIGYLVWQQKLQFRQVILLGSIPLLALIVYYVWIGTYQVGSEVYNYPKSVLVETLYLKGIFPEAFNLNPSKTSLLFLDNDLTHLNFFRHRPYTYLIILMTSTVSGIKFLLSGNSLLLAQTLFIAAAIGSRSKAKFPGVKTIAFIVLPITAGIVFPALFLTHEGFMPRMLAPLLPLYFILGAAAMIETAKQIKPRFNRWVIMAVGIFLLMVFIDLIYPQIDYLAVVQGFNIKLRKDFVGEVARQLEVNTAAPVIITQNSDARKAIYLAGKSILYLPKNTSLADLAEYAQNNQATDMLTDFVFDKDRAIELKKVYLPFPNSVYRLYHYTFR